MGQPPLTLWRWSRNEYEGLMRLGVFTGHPVELIAGQLVVAELQGSYHATAVGAVDDALRALLPSGFIVRAQMPVALDDESEPEPDVAVVRGTRADYRETHPGPPVLVVEVSDSSLDFDRRDKGILYARGGAPDYWIVNLIERVLEVYREPTPDQTAPHRWRYRSMKTFRATAVVAPLELPSVRLAVSTLLP